MYLGGIVITTHIGCSEIKCPLYSLPCTLRLQFQLVYMYFQLSFVLINHYAHLSNVVIKCSLTYVAIHTLLSLDTHVLPSPTRTVLHRYVHMITV